nr:Rz1 family lipoprotein [Escherichia coli]
MQRAPDWQTPLNVIISSSNNGCWQFRSNWKEHRNISVPSVYRDVLL